MIPLVDIVAALKTTLEQIDGLHVDDFVPGTANFPAAFVVPPEIDYQRAMRHGYIALELEVVVLVASSVARQQKDLFDYLDWSGTKSIVAIVDADKTLGLTGINAVAMSSRPLAAEEIASYQAWGAAVRFLIGSTTNA